MIVCIVANKRGYMISYSCVSELYRRLKGIADTMIQSLSIISSVEDCVCIIIVVTNQEYHPVTYSNPMSIEWKTVMLSGCHLQVPGHWKTEVVGV